MRTTFAIVVILTILLSVPVCAHFSGVKICIDPGHGGSDPGAVGQGLRESDINLDIALRARDLMQLDAATVIMTRTTDVYVSLQGRCDIANNAGAERFMCSHCNAFNGAAYGTETYCHPNDSATAYDLRDKVQAEMVAHMGTTNRGGKTNTFYVLANTNMAAILCEVAFIDNAGDAAKLANPAYRQTAANAYLHGLQENYGQAPHDVGTTPALDSTYRAQSYQATMVAGTTATVWVEYNNTGTETWTNSGSNPIRLGCSNPQERSSAFYTAGDWIGPNRPTNMDQATCAPGGYARFSFTMTAPSTPGTYNEYWGLLKEGTAWFGYAGVNFSITVTPALGSITGAVKNVNSGNPIPGASVSLNTGQSTQANGLGVYSFSGLAGATYTVTASAPGYATNTAPAVVTAGQATTADINLTPTDTQPPTVPQNLRRTSVTKSGLTIAWDASTDNIAVAGYRVYRNGTQIGTATGTSYSDSGLSANTGYTYQVDAYDATPNYSAKSAALATGTAGGTWTRSNASQNCYTRSGTPDVVGVGGIAAGYSTTATLLTRRGLVQWDMTGAPTQAETINAADSVRVSLYQYTQTSTTAAADISLYKVNNDWNETNGTWNNVGLGAIYTGATVSCLNVGDRTWSWNGSTEGIPLANRGVYVKNDTNETTNSYAKIFDNRTNIGGSGLPPRLSIDYIDLTAPSDCSISINSGAAYTASAAVTLTLSATDTLSGMSQMQFSDDGTNYSTPEAYATSKSYTLPSGQGLKTVYAKFMDALGNWSAPVSDTITVDTVAPTIAIGAPSVTSTVSGPVTYEITYGGADAVTLAAGDITLNKTNTADAGSVVVSGTGLTTRTVTLSSITGDGTLGISIAAATASDTAGNSALAAGPSATFDVANHVASYGLNNKAVADAIMGTASGNFKFTVWGKVTKIDNDSFTVDDGSSKPVKVIFAGHGFVDNDYVSARGTLDVTGASPVLTAQAVKMH